MEKKLEQPTTNFRNDLLQIADKYIGASQYKFNKAHLELLQDDISNDTYENLTNAEMSSVIEDIVKSRKEQLITPYVKLVNKYGKDNSKIYHYEDNYGRQYLTTIIGTIVMSSDDFKNFKTFLSVIECKHIGVSRNKHFTSRNIKLDEITRHLFFQLFQNHNASYSSNNSIKINWKSLKGIKIYRFNNADLTINMPKDMMI